MVLEKTIPAGETLLIVKSADERRCESASPAVSRGILTISCRKSQLDSITVSIS